MSWLRSKIKQVAARASDALAQAADIVAPTLYESRIEEFHHRWSTVARFLESIVHRDLDPTEQRRLLLESHTRDSLQKLVLLLYAEEHALDPRELREHPWGDATVDDIGGGLIHPSATLPPPPSNGNAAQEHAPRPCHEYLIERQLLPYLCDVGRRDQPCGIMSLALQFITALLSRINSPLLPTREVRVSLIALIQAATKKEVEDPVVRKCLVNLLNVLWKKLRYHPVQSDFFFLHAASVATGHLQARGGNQSPSSEISDVVVFTGLLPHMYAVGKTGEKCREALVIASGMYEPALARFVLTLTPFCHYAVNGIITAFDALPKTLPDELARYPNGTFPMASARRGIESEIQTLATRLHFCSTLTMVGRVEISDVGEYSSCALPQGPCTSITNEITTQFRDRFLMGPLLDGLMDTSEASARTATLYARIILEELATCCRDTRSNPLLQVLAQFFLENKTSNIAKQLDANERELSVDETPVPAEPRLSSELLHRMDSLSSSLSVATIDLFTSLLELQDEYVDHVLLGDFASETSGRRRSLTALSPRTQLDGAIWFASRFPDSAVAANAHIWKIPAFDSTANKVEIPASSQSDGNGSDRQIVSLLSYIADAEYVTCQRAPAVLPGWDSDDEDEDYEPFVSIECSDPGNQVEGSKRSRRDSDVASSSSRTAAKRNSVKPLKDASLKMSIPSFSPVSTKLYHPVEPCSAVEGVGESTRTLIRLVLNRLERVLESSFYENLALSGLVSTIAQKSRCSAVVFDTCDALGVGRSIRSVLEEVHADALRRTSRLTNGTQRLRDVRRKLVDENNEASLNDHEAETRLLCGFVVLEEILKELCSILFARERVKSLPIKPEGYYLEPKRTFSSAQRTASSDNLPAVTQVPPEGGSGADTPGGGVSTTSISQEFEQLLADAESTMGSLLSTPEPPVSVS